jgi:hypothetical protein
MIKKILLGILVVILGIVGYYVYMFTRKGGGGFKGEKAPEVKVGNHSEKFNKSIDSMLHAYFAMSYDFTNADMEKVKAGAAALLQRLDSVPMNELKKDTALVFVTDSMSYSQAKDNIKFMVSQANITDMRKAYKDLSESLYTFLKGIHYAGKNIYWVNCGMPFGENTSANWLSEKVEFENPYLGVNHPEYKNTMLHCGEILDTIKAK